MDNYFKGKRALVTGAGKGLGRAITVALADKGVNIVAVSRTQSDLDSLKEQYPSMVTICADLSDWEKTRSSIEGLGYFDFLVNNAAISIRDSFLEIKPDDFDTMFSTNVKSLINVSQIVAKDMVASGKGGSIVNVSSVASKVALKDHTLYCGTKGAVDQITRVMALELGPHQIRVNAVNPTVVMTEMGKQAWGDKAKSEPVLSRIPLNRFAEESDVVSPVLFLLSNQSMMINGEILTIDGGYSIS